VETTTITNHQLWERMRRRGVRQCDLAEASGVRQADISNVLRGRYVGPRTRERVRVGIVRLSLDRDDVPTLSGREPVVIRIRQL